VVELLSDYTTETLPWRVRLTVRLHLSRCLGCSAYASQLVEIIRASRNLVSVELENGQLQSLLAAFAAHSFGSST
jgi:hypothetical protein